MAEIIIYKLLSPNFEGTVYVGATENSKAMELRYLEKSLSKFKKSGMPWDYDASFDILEHGDVEIHTVKTLQSPDKNKIKRELSKLTKKLQSEHYDVVDEDTAYNESYSSVLIKTG